MRDNVCEQVKTKRNKPNFNKRYFLPENLRVIQKIKRAACGPGSQFAYDCAKAWVDRKLRMGSFVQKTLSTNPVRKFF